MCAYCNMSWIKTRNTDSEECTVNVVETEILPQGNKNLGFPFETLMVDKSYIGTWAQVFLNVTHLHIIGIGLGQ